MSGEDNRDDIGIVWHRALKARLRRRQFLGYAALGVGTAGLGALGCTNTSEPPRAAIGEPTKAPKNGGVFKNSVAADPPDYDCQSVQSYSIQWPYSFISHRLIKLDRGPDVAPNELKISPDLAEKWEQQDPTTYTFTMRKGVPWHDVPPVNGREVVADDAVYTYLRYQKNPTFVMSWLFSDIDRVEAKDKYTVVFHLKQPAANFLLNMAWNYSWIISPEIVEKEGDLRKHLPVGMGPYLFASHDRGLNINYKRNPNWFKKPLPYVDEVQYLIMPDANAVQTAFMAGEIMTYSASNIKDAETMRKNMPSALSENYLSSSWRSPILNTRRPPFDDKRVRKAICMAIDQKEIADALFQGEGRFNGIINASMEDYAVPEEELKQIYKYDLEGAKKLLAEAGYPNGFQATLTNTTGYGQLTVDEGEMFVAQMKKLGINMQIKMLDYATYIKQKAEYNFDTAFGSYTPYIEPGQYLEGHYLSTSNRNESGLKDPKLDDMIRQQKQALNPTERKKIIQDIERYVAQEVNTNLPMPATRTTAMWNSRVKGFRVHNTYGYNMETMWIDQ